MLEELFTLRRGGRLGLVSRNYCMCFGRVRVSHEAIKIAQSCEFFGISRFLPHFRCFLSFSLVSRELFRWPTLVVYILRGARQLKEAFRVKKIEIKRAVGPLHSFATNYRLLAYMTLSLEKSPTQIPWTECLL